MLSGDGSWRTSTECLLRVAEAATATKDSPVVSGALTPQHRTLPRHDTSISAARPTPSHEKRHAQHGNIGTLATATGQCWCQGCRHECCSQTNAADASSNVCEVTGMTPTNNCRSTDIQGRHSCGCTSVRWTINHLGTPVTGQCGRRHAAVL